MLRVLGMDDPQRSEDLLAAVRSRQRVDQEETRCKVDGLASGPRKANRTELLAVGDWRQNPTPARLPEAGSAMRNLALLEAELANACVYDQASINEAKRRAGR
jgi:hypothetical protein